MHIYIRACMHSYIHKCIHTYKHVSTRIYDKKLKFCGNVLKMPNFARNKFCKNLQYV